MPTFSSAILGPILFCISLSVLSAELKPGSTLELAGKKAQIKSMEMLPLVESEYTRLFRFDSAVNPKLIELRERYELEKVVASGQDEFRRQILLMDWVHNRFKKFGQPSTGTRGALDILKGIEGGHSFFCTQYAQLFASSAASLGWVDRVLALRRHQDRPEGGSTEHSTTEIWSNQYGKWVMLDPTSNMFLEKRGVPLNAHEIREEWFYNNGEELVFVVGKAQQRYRKGDLPIFLKRFDGFGDLVVDHYELDKYGFIGYIPNTDLMDSGFDYGQMFIVKDALCDGTKWHKRKNPTHPATDPYFPIGQAAMDLKVEKDQVLIELTSFTPNFREFQVRFDEGQWKRSEKVVRWKPKGGLNRMEARTVNAFGVSGPLSHVELEVSE